jgi:hypothetical protein
LGNWPLQQVVLQANEEFPGWSKACGHALILELQFRRSPIMHKTVSLNSIYLLNVCAPLAVGGKTRADSYLRQKPFSGQVIEP